MQLCAERNNITSGVDMVQTQTDNPLHGITLEKMLTDLVAYYKVLYHNMPEAHIA